MKVIVDCDPGNGIPGANVDDAVALTVAMAAPELDVRAVWTVFGNTSAREGYGAAERLFAGLRSSPPVLRQGFDHPMSGDRERWRSRLDAPSQDPATFSLWGSSEAPARSVRGSENDPLPGLVEDVRAAGAGTTLACLGPLTNIARLAQQAPATLASIDRIYLMGGALADPELVDTNFAVDPVAAAMVLRSGIPLTIVPLDVTRTTCLSAADWAEIGKRAPDAAAATRVRRAAAWLEPWLEHSARTRPVDGMWLHDLVVIAMLVDPSIVRTETATVTLLDHPSGKLARSAEGVAVELVTQVDNRALLALLARAVLSPRSPLAGDDLADTADSPG